jgi:hypothetical protein
MLTWKTKAEWDEDVLRSCRSLAPLLQAGPGRAHSAEQQARQRDECARWRVGAWVPLLFLDVLITLVRLK